MKLKLLLVTRKCRKSRGVSKLTIKGIQFASLACTIDGFPAFVFYFFYPAEKAEEKKSEKYPLRKRAAIRNQFGS